MIKAIIFDFGGVILLHPTRFISFILEKMFPDAFEEVNKLWEENKIALNSGKISSKQLISKLKNAVESDKTLDELLQMWKDIYTEEAKDVNWELLELVEKLKKHYKVYLFTDTIDIHDAINSKRGLYEKFHGVYKSYEEGISKHAGKAAFLHVLNRINAQPEECVFIDDITSNVETAEHLGMKAILYKGNEELIKDFKQLGIKHF